MDKTLESLLARALSVVTTRQWQEVRPPSPYDDADREFAYENLVDAAREFINDPRRAKDAG